MYFTQAKLSEYFSGVPMHDLGEVEVVLNAVRSIANPDIEGGTQTVVATLATDRTWTAHVPGKTANCVYIHPCPGQPYAVGFSHNQRRLDTDLAKILNRGLGTVSIQLTCTLPISDQGQFRLDTNWLYQLFVYLNLSNEHTPNGDSLAEHLAYSNARREMLCFRNPYGIQLSIDDTRLGPIVDSDQRPLRSYGYETLQGPAYAGVCEVILSLTDTTGFAFDERQNYLRQCANQILGIIAPQG